MQLDILTTLQSHTRPVQGQNRVFPVYFSHTGKNLFTLAGIPLMKTDFFLLGKVHRKNPVFITAMGLQCGVESSPFTFRRPCRWHHTVSTLLYNEDGSLWGIAASQVHKIWTHFEKMSLYIEYLYLYYYIVKVAVK